MVRPTILGLVADDLTGAADSAAGLAAHGWRVVLHLRHDLDLDLDLDQVTVREASGDDPHEAAPTVLAIPTRARALPDPDAARTTRAAVDGLLAAGAERLYLKIDSTVRGSVAGQLDGALSGWSTTYPRAAAVICPAFPGLGRTVRSGVVLVDGVPVAGTAAGRDPVTPVAVSDLARIIPGAVLGDVGLIGVARKLLLDAETNTDLDELARHLAEAPPGVVMVGSGGLAAALGRCWGSAPRHPDVAVGGRSLVAVSSLHPVAGNQLDHLRSVAGSETVDVLTTSSEAATSPGRAARTLARRVAAALTEHPYRSLVLVGGDGAAAVLDHLGADRVVIDGTVLDGCPTGVVEAGVADGIRIVTKAGGFGATGSLSDIVHRLTAVQAATSPALASVSRARPTPKKEAP